MGAKKRLQKRFAINLFRKFIQNIRKVESNARTGKVGKIDLIAMRSHLLMLVNAASNEKEQEHKEDVMGASQLALDICERIESKQIDGILIENCQKLREWYEKSIESFKKE